MSNFNVYLCGVGGQGIGLLSEVLLRGGDRAGMQAKAVDTHGLAQRGGIVVSHLRFGDSIYSPMVQAKEADLVIALERHEALRGADFALKDGATLIYYDTIIQPLGVRLGEDQEVSKKQITEYCANRKIVCHRIADDGLEDPRMQNIAVLAHVCRLNLIPEIKKVHLLGAMEDLLSGPVLEKNLLLFNSLQ